MQSNCPQAEDVLLRRVFYDKPAGFYVDVGAGNPVDCSVTYHLYHSLGWRGVNIEPNPVVFKRLCKQRPKDINKRLAACDSTGTATLRVFAGHENRSTINDILKKQYFTWRTYKDYACETKPLDEILDENIGGQSVDLLKIDAEGSEHSVLKSIDLLKWSPKLVVVEATSPGTSLPIYTEWEYILTGAGYDRVLFDGLNCWYTCDGEIANRLSVPVNVFDHYDAYRWPKHRKVQPTARQ